MFNDDGVSSMELFGHKIGAMLEDAGTDEVDYLRDVHILRTDLPASSTSCTQIHNICSSPILRRRTTQFHSDASRATETVKANSCNNGAVLNTKTTIDTALN
jgi:hypothetical protein